MRILIFGDSIAQGYYDIVHGGWANLLSVDIMKRKSRETDFPTECFNVAISGNFTRHVIDRLETEADCRKWGGEPIKFIFAVGINDAHLNNSVPVSSPTQYRQDLEKLYKKASRLSRDIVFVGLTPVNESETRPWIFNTGAHDLEWSNNRIQEFDQVLEAFTKAKSTLYIPLFADMLRATQGGSSLMMDGLHPNTEGHRYMYGKIKEALGVL